MTVDSESGPGDGSGNAPLVSCIVPTHNRSSRVTEAIDSLLREPYEPLEIVIVDDGSTDDTLAVLEREYGDEPRVKIVPIESSIGAARARNRGLRRASGAFVTFMDDDDVNVPGRIEGQVRLARRHDADFVTCTRCYYQTDRSTRLVGPETEAIDLEDMWVANRVVSVTPLVRTELMRETLFDASLEVAQDYDAWLRCFENCSRTVNYSRPAIVYRRVEDETITGNRLGKLRARLHIYRRHRGHMDVLRRIWFLGVTALKAVVPDPRRVAASVRERTGLPGLGESVDLDEVSPGESASA